MWPFLVVVLKRSNINIKSVPGVSEQIAEASCAGKCCAVRVSVFAESRTPSLKPSTAVLVYC